MKLIRSKDYYFIIVTINLVYVGGETDHDDTTGKECTQDTRFMRWTMTSLKYRTRSAIRMFHLQQRGKTYSLNFRLSYYKGVSVLIRVSF